MASSEKTPYLQLNTWVEEDIPDVEDFNRDNAILDQALKRRTVSLYQSVILAASQWIHYGEIYRQVVHINAEDGMRVDFACDIHELDKLQGPIVAVNDGGTVYAQTNAPPSEDITVQATIVQIDQIA